MFSSFVEVTVPCQEGIQLPSWQDTKRIYLDWNVLLKSYTNLNQISTMLIQISSLGFVFSFMDVVYWDALSGLLSTVSLEFTLYFTGLVKYTDQTYFPLSNVFSFSRVYLSCTHKVFFFLMDYYLGVITSKHLSYFQKVLQVHLGLWTVINFI